MNKDETMNVASRSDGSNTKIEAQSEVQSMITNQMNSLKNLSDQISYAFESLDIHNHKIQGYLAPEIPPMPMDKNPDASCVKDEQQQTVVGGKMKEINNMIDVCQNSVMFLRQKIDELTRRFEG